MGSFYEEFGRLLRDRREEAGLTQGRLAESVGLTRASIANIEAGRQRVALHVFAELAAALDVNPMALLPDPRPILDSALLEASVHDLLSEIPRRWVEVDAKRRR